MAKSKNNSTNGNGDYVPLLSFLRDNDKRNLFQTNTITYFHKTGHPLFDFYFGSVVNLHDKEGNIIAQEPRVGQAAGTYNTIIGKPSSGKAQPVSTMIPTPHGWKELGRLKVGHEVFDHNGQVTTVTGVYPQGKQEIYQVTFDDGRFTLCTLDHLWSVHKISVRYPNKVLKASKIMATKDIISDKKYRYAVPHTKYVAFVSKQVPVEPYKYGLEIGADIERFHSTIVPRRIPKEYLNNSISIRYNLARGIIQSATFEPGLRLFIFDITSKGLLDDITCLFRSLGHIVYDSKSFFKANPELQVSPVIDDDDHILYGIINGREISWLTSLGKTSTHVPLRDRLFIPMTDKQLPGLLSPENTRRLTSQSKFLKINPQGMLWNYREIVDIRRHGVSTESCCCIKVAAKKSLYITSNFVVTHNTTMAVQLAANIIRPYPNSSVHHYDFEQRFDLSRAENISQLHISDFTSTGRYIIKSGSITLEEIKEAIIAMYVVKKKRRTDLLIKTDQLNEFGNHIEIYSPTVFIIDSIAQVISESFSVDSAKDVNLAEELRSNTAGARDAKTLKGFFKDILPLCKEVNIIIYGLNHITNNMSMTNIPPAKMMPFLKLNESLPGGITVVHNSYNLIKLTSMPTDQFTNERDGFEGHMVMVEPIKSSSNQSGNDTRGVSFEMVFSFQRGFDSLRSLIKYGIKAKLIEDNRSKLQFVDDSSYTFSFKNLDSELNEKPIWESIRKFIIPDLRNHLSFVEPGSFDLRSLDY